MTANATKPIRSTGSPGSQRNPLWIRAAFLANDARGLEATLRAAGRDEAADAASKAYLYANQAAALLEDRPAPVDAPAPLSAAHFLHQADAEQALRGDDLQKIEPDECLAKSAALAEAQRAAAKLAEGGDA